MEVGGHWRQGPQGGGWAETMRPELGQGVGEGKIKDWGVSFEAARIDTMALGMESGLGIAL